MSASLSYITSGCREKIGLQKKDPFRGRANIGGEISVGACRARVARPESLGGSPITYSSSANHYIVIMNEGQ